MAIQTVPKHAEDCQIWTLPPYGANAEQAGHHNHPTTDANLLDAPVQNPAWLGNAEIEKKQEEKITDD